ncbi:TIGR03084 family metal-binding protein [Pseudahrensia aquimaris]|uniref:TIGR03084 family metal-binding protein n=1 Tax=Pseudahrensia aquimaris TaxID=744461 RepID=A0ABW3FBC4_9HYPH
MEQAQDFLDESAALRGLVSDLDASVLRKPTAFKGWTIEDVIGHLHIWNMAADLSLRDEAGFHAFFSRVAEQLKTGSMKAFERDYLSDLTGADLVSTWWEGCKELAAHFATADPSARVVWAGPSMSVRSSATARLMETWAHGQEVYDLLGVERVNTDRIRNIVVLGVNTFGWTFKVNGLDVPDAMPHLVLTGPSGAVWTYGDESAHERIEGLAEEFCQVVTQTRNIADTRLRVTGDTATRWMALAQCFAGAAEMPPAPGTRVRAVT